MKNSKNCLVIVGEDDHAFKQEHLKMIEGLQNIKIKTIERANHNSETGDYRESIDIILDMLIKFLLLILILFLLKVLKLEDKNGWN